MNRLLTYLAIAIIYCFTMHSCIEEYFDESSEGTATVELRISMPSIEDTPNTKGSQTIKPDHKEDGSSYECTIPTSKDIDIFVFDNNGSYKGKVSNLVMVGAADASIRIVKGILPEKLLGQSIRMVFMANYKNRDSKSAKEPASENYTEWHSSLTFVYGSISWNPTEDSKIGKYIPMSGECTFKVQQNNYQNIELKRAIAKVRIKVKQGCKYSITELQTHNASEKGFSLEQKPFAVPKNIDALYLPLNFTGLTVNQNSEPFEYYLPEQDAKQTTLKIWMSDGAENKPVEFKYYPSENNYYPIERNYIYEFVIDKKTDEAKADIQVNISPWKTVNEIISEYE